GGLSTGDVVTFMPRPDDPTLVTHRIVGVAVAREGRRSFTTQGEANAAPDADPVTATQLRGLLRYHVPLAGHAATLLDAEQKRGGMVLVAAALFGYALWQLVGAARDRGRHPDEGDAAGVGREPAAGRAEDPAPAAEVPTEAL